MAGIPVVPGAAWEVGSLPPAPLQGRKVRESSVLWGSQESPDGNFLETASRRREQPRLVIGSHLLPITEGEAPRLCPLHGGLAVAKENTTPSSAGWNNALCAWRRDRTPASAAGFGPPRPGRPSRQPMEGLWAAHTLPVSQSEGPCALPTGDRYGSRGGQVPCDVRTRLGRTRNARGV